MDDRITTHHPQGKQGTSISRAKYDVVRNALLAVLTERGEVTFAALTQAVEEKIGAAFDGSVPWYVITVKLDLEARGDIERVPKTRPQRLRRTG